MSLLSDFNTRIEIPVLWGDMDAARHVNNTVYLKWAETGRLAYFHAINNGQTAFNNISIILAWQDCKYIFPMTFPDTALLGIKAVEIREDRFFLETHIFSRNHQRLAAISKQSLMAYDYQALKKAPLPALWIENIGKLDNLYPGKSHEGKANG